MVALLVTPQDLALPVAQQLRRQVRAVSNHRNLGELHEAPLC